MNVTASGGKMTVAMLTGGEKVPKTLLWLRQVKTALAKIGLEPVSLSSRFCALPMLVTTNHEFTLGQQWAKAMKELDHGASCPLK